MLALLTEAAHHSSDTLWAEYWSLLTSGGHWLFEITSDAVVGIIVYKPAAWLWNNWHIKHDAKHHGKEL